MNKATTVRQNLRRALIFSGFLFFPIVQNYFSPYLIVDGAFQGILNGSALVFSGLFISALFFGRAWCGWLCPAGGMLEAAIYIRDKKVSQHINWIKWLVWVPWVIIILIGFISAGGIIAVNPLHSMDQPFSLVDLRSYVVYYFVVALFFVLSLSIGNRAFCHVGCWMAPFLIIGRKLRNILKYPSLQLKTNSENCTDCLTCSRNCPMSLDVNGLVKRGNMEHSECILCGNCVDSCSNSVIRYSL